MLYHNEEKLSREVFKNPPEYFRGAPFWAWNSYMDNEKIDRCVQAVKEMGMGGAFIHSRTGMNHPYMSEEFLDRVEYAHNRLKEHHMYTWLYDEDRWPSGFAGGLVTKKHENRLRFLLFSPECQDGKPIPEEETNMGGSVLRSEERSLLARYQILLKGGYLKDYAVMKEGEPVKEGYDEWFAYMEISGTDPGFNDQSYANNLDARAVRAFLDEVHEKYYERFGDEFGTEIPAIFTDEPHFAGKHYLEFAEQKKNMAMPWADDLEEGFQGRYGYSLLAHLPELFWELGEDQFSAVRYEFHNYVTDRFVNAYADQIGAWCTEHRIALAGHMFEEPTLGKQTHASGEDMRSYRSFGIPGIDMLCDNRELNTAKQCQSVVHQYGKEAMLSELYGVTGWDFDFRRHKLAGDWQAALGVTLRVHHLTWSSMEGEAKRDYPASIGYQSPWYQEYSLVEEHFARVNTAMTRGKAHVRVGVIHPIESFWLYWGPMDQTGNARREMEADFRNLAEWLLYGTIDFDYISEALLPELAGEKVSVCLKKNSPALKVGEMNYEVIFIPNCRTLRSSTLDVLEKFAKMGGRVIFAGDAPFLVNARASDRGTMLAEKTEKIPYTRQAVLKALEPYRDIRILEEEGYSSESLIYQMREEGKDRWVFIAHAKTSEILEEYVFDCGGSQWRRKFIDFPVKQNLTVSIRGRWNMTVYDTVTGEIYPAETVWKENETVIYPTLYDQDSLLLHLEAGEVQLHPYQYPEKISQEKGENIGKEKNIRKEAAVPYVNDVDFSEPNVSVLDIAEYRFDRGEWHPEEETLRIDNLFREKLGYPVRNGGHAQPWVRKGEEPLEHQLSLRYTVECECVLTACELALEYGADTGIYLDGKRVPCVPDGWYVDPCIYKIPLPVLTKGVHILQVDIPYNSRTNVENMMILGDFTVRVNGKKQVLCAPVRRLSFGNLTTMGFPFYGGNVIYRIPFVSDGSRYVLSANLFRSPYLGVKLDGRKLPGIAFSPYECSLGEVEKGEHLLEIIMYGNRVNTFGALHNCNLQADDHGPASYRTTGCEWAYEYQLQPTGILKTPVLIIME
ncbi:hypothetical protein ACTNEW_08095 [Blautia sp. HCP3S3_G3]|uniref:hypothetical protein n=1 Tax=Blautia sp. HCP3S3_G3 TaxID=3438913 RepID=UPI003F88A7E4